MDCKCNPLTALMPASFSKNERVKWKHISQRRRISYYIPLTNCSNDFTILGLQKTSIPTAWTFFFSTCSWLPRNVINQKQLQKKSIELWTFWEVMFRWVKYIKSVVTKWKKIFQMTLRNLSLHFPNSVLV